MEYFSHPCGLFVGGTCAFGLECSLSHGEAEEVLHPLLFRTAVCFRPLGSCRGAVDGCCDAHDIPQFAVANRLKKVFILAPGVHKLADMLKRALQQYDEGYDMVGDPSLPCSVKIGVLTAKASLLFRQHRPQQVVDQCGGADGAQLPAGGFSARRRALQIQYSEGERHHIRSVEQGLQLFAASVVLERGCKSAPVPRISKDVEVALETCVGSRHGENVSWCPRRPRGVSHRPTYSKGGIGRQVSKALSSWPDASSNGCRNISTPLSDSSSSLSDSSSPPSCTQPTTPGSLHLPPHQLQPVHIPGRAQDTAGTCVSEEYAASLRYFWCERAEELWLWQLCNCLFNRLHLPRRDPCAHVLYLLKLIVRKFEHVRGVAHKGLVVV